MRRWLILLGVAALFGIGFLTWRWVRASNGEKHYRTARVGRGDLVQVVRATGTVQPIKTVQVGTQVTGPVQKLYVDYNDRVKQGQVVAQIDPTVYQAQVDQGRANWRAAQANVDSTRAKLIQAEAELKRNRELKVRDLVSQSDLDTTVANRDVLAAQVKQAEAAVEQTRAALRLSETNLAYTTIRSPVDGVVIARNVNEGQTVVASFSSQTLFVIATDLKQMQVEASIPEADIGKIREGQAVKFTVDAYPDLEFEGRVSEVRLAATITSNVVTYPVIISAPNPEEKLLPTLTASVSIEVARHEKVLRVPNAALRFKYEPGEAASGAGGGPASGSGTTPGGPGRHQVWAPEGKDLKAVPVHPGITDGSYTEVVEGALKEGQEVVTGIMEPGEKAPVAVNNPFMPKFPGRGKGGGAPHPPR